ncbi:MAG: hypothetical protein IH602_11500 [Bryobacteraceae bacterium]|nr:hypothetical protein [Bryobacteraceae bacterium]
MNVFLQLSDSPSVSGISGISLPRVSSRAVGRLIYGGERMMASVAKVVLALYAGWLVWLWFISLWAAGEAAFRAPVPGHTIAQIWGILCLACGLMFLVGLMSSSVPWGYCALAAIYPYWRFANAFSQSHMTAPIAAIALFVLLSGASALGTLASRKCRKQKQGEAG